MQVIRTYVAGKDPILTTDLLDSFAPVLAILRPFHGPGPSDNCFGSAVSVSSTSF